MTIDTSFELFAIPVKQFLDTIDYSQALIVGGLIRDLTLGYPPRDTDVIIKSDLTYEQLTDGLDEARFKVFTNYGDDKNHFNSCYRFLIKDLLKNIDYLFVHDYLSLSAVIDSFDCSLNKGYGCPVTGFVNPPNLDTFTYTGTDKKRFSRLAYMYYNYMVHSNVN